jgi:hypothetical protein
VPEGEAMTKTEARVLDIPELAKQLGRTPVAARRLVERGVVPSRRLGGRVVILVDELEAFLKALPSGARRRLDAGVDDHRTRPVSTYRSPTQ